MNAAKPAAPRSIAERRASGASAGCSPHRFPPDVGDLGVLGEVRIGVHETRESPTEASARVQTLLADPKNAEDTNLLASSLRPGREKCDVFPKCRITPSRKRNVQTLAICERWRGGGFGVAEFWGGAGRRRGPLKRRRRIHLPTSLDTWLHF